MTSAKSTAQASPARELLNRKETGSGPHPLRPLDHLAFAIILDSGASVEEGLNAVSRLRRDFVDWNEVRVARSQEVVRTLGDIPNAEAVAARIREEYNSFFDKRGALSFDFLGVGKPAETRRLLVQAMPHLCKGAVSLLLYEFCAGASLPLSDAGLRQARRDGAVGKSADRNQLLRVLNESLEAGETCILLQYWELEGMGDPYGDGGRKSSAAKAKKSARAKVKKKA